MRATVRENLASRSTGRKFRVDVEAGIIYNARIIGTKSMNRRVYPIDVLRRRYRLYEGRQVYVDHAIGKKGARPMGEWGGVTRAVYVESDGVYGNVHVLKDTPAGRMLLEAAIKAPDTFGLSPYHVIDFERENGLEVIRDIVEVISVDAVTRPATNKSLYEENAMAQEQDDGMMMAAAPAVPGIEGAFLSLQQAVMASEDHDDNEKVAMLKDVMKLKAKMLGTDDSADDGAGDGAPGGDGGAGAGESVQTAPQLPKVRHGKRSLKGLQRELRESRIENLARAANLQLTPDLLDMLVDLPDNRAVYEQIEALRRQVRRPYGSGSPRSAARQEEAVNGQRLRKMPPMLTRGATREAVEGHYRS